MKRGMRGMTLLEVLLVIALTAAISVTGVMGLSQLTAIFRLRSAGDEIRALLQYGRELATANKNQVAYSLVFSSGVVSLTGGGTEVGRFQPPAEIIFAPASFSWGFTPLSGALTGCALPCQLTLSNVGNSEIITIQANGVIN